MSLSPTISWPSFPFSFIQWSTLCIHMQYSNAPPLRYPNSSSPPLTRFGCPLSLPLRPKCPFPPLCHTLCLNQRAHFPDVFISFLRACLMYVFSRLFFSRLYLRSIFFGLKWQCRFFSSSFFWVCFWTAPFGENMFAVSLDMDLCRLTPCICACSAHTSAACAPLPVTSTQPDPTRSRIHGISWLLTPLRLSL